jgi:hypothetical protein
VTIAGVRSVLLQAPLDIGAASIGVRIRAA